MRICHVSQHLPPDQAANALLPWHLGDWARQAGDEVTYVAHPPRAGAAGELPGPVTWVPPRTERLRWPGMAQLDSLREARHIARLAAASIDRADVVHVHSNGLLAEAVGLSAVRRRRPVVLTLYGTEIWHYKPRRPIDLFTRLYRHARQVTFYSQGLLDRARELGLDRPGLSVAYPAVADAFTWHDGTMQPALRASLGLRRRHLLVNVKRLHPLAGQRYLLEAMPAVLRRHPDTDLVICGTGPLADDLQAQARALGVDQYVRFAGLVGNETIARYCAAADVFVLPSLLEACPTVALEALAAGTPVVSADHPGGVELAGLFGSDVKVVPKEDARALGGSSGGGARSAAPDRGDDSRDRRARVPPAGGLGAVSCGVRGGAPQAALVEKGSNMTLVEQVGTAITAAMKARDQATLGALRMLKAALMNKEVERGRALDESESLAVVAGLIKQRRESIDQFGKAGRNGSRRQGVGRGDRVERFPAAGDVK